MALGPAEGARGVAGSEGVLQERSVVEGDRGSAWGVDTVLGRPWRVRGEDGSMRRLQATRVDGDLSLRFLSGRGASAASHAGWGGVEVRNGVGVHARPELGERRQGSWSTAPQGIRAWSFPSRRVRWEVREWTGAGLGQGAACTHGSIGDAVHRTVACGQRWPRAHTTKMHASFWLDRLRGVRGRVWSKPFIQGSIKSIDLSSVSWSRG